MRFSLNFVKDFLKINTSPVKLASVLTMAGMEVERLQKLGDDWIFDIEVTTNRYDWLSILGIAKEISAILGTPLDYKYPAVKKAKIPDIKNITIEDKSDCPYYIGRTIKNVKVGVTGNKFRQRILNCGIGSVNDIVDIMLTQGINPAELAGELRGLADDVEDSGAPETHYA